MTLYPPARPESPAAGALATRIEHDSFGDIEVPVEVLWGAQTARSLQFFAIGAQRMPLPLIHAMAWVKWAAAEVNADLHRLPAGRARAVAEAALQVAAGAHDEAFPLSVWQTGSGTQSHMNLNEVLARLASRSLPAGATALHAHDEVNLGQSSNDVFPTAMHLAVLLALRQDLLPALAQLRASLQAQARALAGIIKTGRTHLQDATPVTLGQEFGGYIAQLDLARAALQQAEPALQALAIGATAVGTGLNTHPQFGAQVAAVLARRLDLPLHQADNLFAALAGHEPLVALHAGLRSLAIVLIKLGNDLRLMGSGPRAGLGELLLPANEPGSSIMPGKVNPTQVEALQMVCAQVIGHDVAVGLAASQGQFELNVGKPLIALDVLDSLQLLSDAMRSFALHCVDGLQPDRTRIAELLARSLMLVTALTPHLGHARAAAIAQRAQREGSTLREAALAEGGLTAEEFDAWVDPRLMLAPQALPPP